MKYELLIAIDVGRSGAIATYYKKEAKTYPMPYTLEDMKDLFQHFDDITTNSICFIEKVNVRPDDLKHFGKAVNIQKMLTNFEQLKTMLYVYGIKYMLVSPQAWQKTLGLNSTKEETKTERKRRYKMVAKNKFKMLKVTLKNCDALLILNYGYIILNIEPEMVICNLK